MLPQAPSQVPSTLHSTTYQAFPSCSIRGEYFVILPNERHTPWSSPLEMMFVHWTPTETSPTLNHRMGLVEDDPQPRPSPAAVSCTVRCTKNCTKTLPVVLRKYYVQPTVLLICSPSRLRVHLSSYSTSSTAERTECKVLRTILSNARPLSLWSPIDAARVSNEV